MARRGTPGKRLAPKSSANGDGIDLDPRNDPTYPIRIRSQDDGPGMNWTRPPLQRSTVEVLQSIEHNRRPAVFGTSTPPKGVSGVFRRAAFRFSESDWRHWLMLMGADRVNVIEGVVADLLSGRIPNIPAEMGARAAWRYNRSAFVLKTAIIAVFFATVVVSAIFLASYV